MTSLDILSSVITQYCFPNWINKTEYYKQTSLGIQENGHMSEHLFQLKTACQSYHINEKPRVISKDIR